VDLDHVLRKGVLAHLVLALIREEFHDFGTMITLKLNHLSHIRVLDDGSIACIFLFEGFEEGLWAIILRQALDSRQRLATVALLNTDMDVIFSGSITNVVGERIINLEIFDGHKQGNEGVGRGR